MRYNLTVCPHGIVPIDPAAKTHRLDIALALADGSILATVTDGSRAVAGAAVLLVPDPVQDDAIELRNALRQVEADGDGRAIITGLLPGRYRITAYAKDVPWGDDPDLKRRLRAGQEVRVAPHQAAVIEVRTLR